MKLILLSIREHREGEKFGSRPIFRDDEVTRKRRTVAFLDLVASGELRNAKLKIDETIAVCKLWNLMKGFIADFSQRAIEVIEPIAAWDRKGGKCEVVERRSSLMADPAAMMSTEFLQELHPNELTRLQRGFFHFELICRVVRPRNFKFSTFTTTAFRKLVRTHFPHWQLEEMATIWQYLCGEYRILQWTISKCCILTLPPPLHTNELFACLQREQEEGVGLNVNFIHPHVFDFSKFPTDDSHFYKDAFLVLPALGFAFLSKIMSPELRTPFTSLKDTISLLAPVGPLQNRNPSWARRGWSHRDPQTSTGPILVDLTWLDADLAINASVRDAAHDVRALNTLAPGHWNHGWTLYTRWHNNQDLRRAGVIFWDLDRISGIMDISKKAYRAHKLVQPPEPDLRLDRPEGYPFKVPNCPAVVAPYQKDGWWVRKADWEAFKKKWQIPRCSPGVYTAQATSNFLRGINED